MTTAVIIGTGFNLLNLQIEDKRTFSTKYGIAQVLCTSINQQPFLILPRHGKSHQLAPHQINYQANIQALFDLEVTRIIAIAAVGVINTDFPKTALILPDQLIDYTYGRAATFSDENDIKHIDFTKPYDENLRKTIQNIADDLNISTINRATYGITQGPRLETKAEIIRLKQDGCDIVGMTGMPEAVLAKERNISYATIGLFANWGAGLTDNDINMDKIRSNLQSGMKSVRDILSCYFD